MPRRHWHKKVQASRPRPPLKDQLRRICAANFNAATCVNFIIMAIYYLIFVTGTDYIKSTYNTTLGTAGFTSGVMVIGCLAGRFVCGNIIGVMGYQPLLAAGIIFFAASNAILFLVNSMAVVYVARFVAGISVGICGTVTATIIARVIPPDQKGFGISLFSMSTVLALAIGPFLGIALYQHMPYETMMAWMIAIALLALVFLFFLRDLPPMSHKLRPVFQITSYIDPRVTRFGIMIFLAFLGYGCLQAFMSTYAKAYGLTEAASAFFPLYAAVALCSRPFTGKLMDRRGEHMIIYPVLIALAAGFFLLAWTSSSIALLAAAILFGFGYGNLQSIGQTVSITLVTPSRFPQATSTFFIFMDFGIGLGPYIFGQIIPMLGYGMMYLLLAATILLSLLLYYAIYARRIS